MDIGTSLARTNQKKNCSDHTSEVPAVLFEVTLAPFVFIEDTNGNSSLSEHRLTETSDQQPGVPPNLVRCSHA